MFPKIHNSENLERPVLSSVYCHTTRIYVDHHLQSHVKELKSYVKDSNDFIKKKINNNLSKIPENSILVRMDICSLYTNTLHKEGIKAV